MSFKLLPYAEYKNTGSNWIEKVPEHWSIPRLGFLGRCVSERGQHELPLLSVFLRRGVIQYADGGRQVHKPSLDLSLYQVVRPGYLVLNNQQAWRGSVGVSKYTGIVSPAYVVYDMSQVFDQAYADALFQTQSIVGQFVVASKGVGDIQRDIYAPWLKNVRVPVPPLAEQDDIGRFIRYIDLRVSRLLKTKRRLIELLNEQKQAIIHRAVTRGLDPAVPLKPSGVEWLGDVPEHWRCLRSRYLYREIDVRSVHGDEVHLSMTQDRGLIPSDQLSVRRLVSESYAGGKICCQGDLVLNRLKAHLGVFALAPSTGVISPDYSVFRPIQDVEARYFEIVYRTPACRVELRKRAKGIVQGFWRLYTDDFYDIPMPVPPRDEQEAILKFLDEELLSLNEAIAKTNAEIAFIREYRTRLVSDVVTGQLDVRWLTLPEMEDEPLAPEDADEETEEEGTDEAE